MVSITLCTFSLTIKHFMYLFIYNKNKFSVANLYIKAFVNESLTQSSSNIHENMWDGKKIALNKEINQSLPTIWQTFQHSTLMQTDFNRF